MNDLAINDVLQKALAEHTGALTTFIAQQKEQQQALSNRLLDVEQKGGARPASTGMPSEGELTAHLMKSDGLAAYVKGSTPSATITVPRALLKAALLNATGSSQPLVAADRRPGIVVAPERRFTMRDVIPSVPTSSNMVEFPRELTFTNAAASQGSGSSPAETEGQPKAESSMTFELATAPVITLAHWIPASRQVLSDAPALQQHVENRLLYGLRLIEEEGVINGTGTGGELNGLVTNATAFAGGSTNLTALDAVALGMAQLIASNYAPSAIVVNPTDWMSSSFLLAKNSQGEYLLGSPGTMAEPRLWGIPVIVTGSMTAGSFLVMDAARVGYIADREDAIVRISDSHSDYFTRNLCAILVEERLAMVVQQSGAMVYGPLSHAG